MKRKTKRFEAGGLNPYQGDDVDYFSGARNASGAISRNDQVDERDRREMAMAEMAKSRPAAKAPIVTKEQMKKAGFDNLRDYLNAQRGLTRKKDTPATKPATNRYIDKKSDDDLAYRAPKMGDAGFMAKRMTPKEVKAQSMRNRIEDLYGKKSGGMISASKRADGCATKGKTRGRII